MPAQQLRSFLDSNHVKYRTISHSPAYTAQEVAASAHIPGKELAKTVIVKVDGEFTMAVLPASTHVSLSRLRTATGAENAELASESEFFNAGSHTELVQLAYDDFDKLVHPKVVALS
jgi:Ala-tRNA(Pro) deacylase